MRQDVLRDSLPILASMLGDRLGLKVRMEGTRAWTTGDVVVLPALSADDPAARVLAMGFLGHEAAGHVAHTDFGVVALCATPLEKELENILEDIRVEQCAMRRYPGIGLYLAQLCVELTRRGWFRAQTPEDNPPEILQGYVLKKLRAEVLGQTVFEPMLPETARAFELTFGTALKTELDELLLEASGLDSTAAALALARRIIELLQEEQPDQPTVPQGQKDQDQEEQQGASQGGPEEENDQGEDAGDGQGQAPGGSSGQVGQDDQQASDDGASPGEENDDQGDGQGQGDSPGDDPGQDVQPGQASQGPDAGAASIQSPGQQGGQPVGQGSGLPGPGDQQPAAGVPGARERVLDAVDGDFGKDLGEILKEELGVSGEQAQRDGSAVTMASAGDFVPDNHGRIVVDFEAARRQTQALRTRLAGLLQAQTLMRSPPRRSGRRIDCRTVHRLGIGDGRVFQGKTQKRGVKTGVHLLVDTSISMKEDARMVHAWQAAAAMALALANVKGVSLGCTAFPHAGVQTMVAPVLRHGAALDLEDFTLAPNGGTPLAPALWWVAGTMARLDVDRRIIVIVTDGDPDNAEAVAQVMGYLRSVGLEVLCLGIRKMAAPSLFDQHRLIMSVDEIAPALFGLLEAVLA